MLFHERTKSEKVFAIFTKLFVGPVALERTKTKAEKKKAC
jgi:hypothetical protein